MDGLIACPNCRVDAHGKRAVTRKCAACFAGWWSRSDRHAPQYARCGDCQGSTCAVCKGRNVARPEDIAAAVLEGRR